MDLNYLLGRHQQSLHRASSATSLEARCAHRGMAIGYADRIRAYQQDVGAGLLVEAA